MAAAVSSFKLPLILVRPHRVPQVVSAVPVIGGGSAQANISDYGVVPRCTILVNPTGRLNVAKKSKKAKRGAAARKKKRDEIR
jgi:hypothetical protein